MSLQKMYRVICPPHSGGRGTIEISEKMVAEVCPSCGWKNKKCRPLPDSVMVEIPDVCTNEAGRLARLGR
jgi:predicted RNA-binding Zn-ribbon protein involved in translation (DUF1610 family)